MRHRPMAQTAEAGIQVPYLYDRCLLLTAIGLISLGLLMVASASSVISDRMFGYPFYYLIRQSAYLLLGLILAFIILRIEIQWWEKLGFYLLILSFLLLIAVLIPHVGREVNGSTRWISLGPISIQVAELAKIFVVIYIAGYCTRHADKLRNELSGFLKPIIILGMLGGLLLIQPDFGSTVVIFATVLGMLFLAGVRLWLFAILLAAAIGGMAFLAISSPYRLERLTTFLNPWVYQFDSGYQLTQSLIAFGRGGWFGSGLGDSVQKLFYLPEAHTDFIYAVLAEELGLVGAIVVILLFALLVGRAFCIARRAHFLGKTFAAYLAYGFAIWLGVQAAISLGVNMGALPTKGLTLPLFSYGGSSLVVNCLVLAMLFRIDYESRQIMLGLKK